MHKIKSKTEVTPRSCVCQKLNVVGSVWVSGCISYLSLYYPILSPTSSLYPFQIPTIDNTLFIHHPPYHLSLSHLSLLQTRPSQKNGKYFPFLSFKFQSPRLPECRGYNAVNVWLFAFQSPNSILISKVVRCSPLITLSAPLTYVWSNYGVPTPTTLTACYFPIHNRNLIWSFHIEFFVFGSNNCRKNNIWWLINYFNLLNIKI